MNRLIVLVALLLSVQTSFADTNADFVAAASEGQTDTLATLMSASADVSVDGHTAVISAAFAAVEYQGSGESFAGQVEAIQMLVTAGVDVDEHFDNGYTALMMMALLGQTDTVRQLLDAGADVNSVAGGDGSTALIFAVYGGTIEIVSMLIDAGADLDAADAGTGDTDGRTALSYAEEKNRADIVDVLTQAGAK